MDDDDLNKLQFMLDYYDEWLRRNKENQQLVPKVQEQRDFIQWEIDALSQRPDEAQEVPYPNISESLKGAAEQMQNALPMLPAYNLLSVNVNTAFTTSGTVNIYAYVARVGDIPVPATQAYAEKYVWRYQQLQQTYQRVEEVRLLVGKLKNPQTEDRFRRAIQAYMTSKSGSISRTSVGIEIRDLVDGVKGDLWNLAKHSPKENMTWETMSARLAIDGSNSPSHMKLLSQKSVRASLITQLSDVAKDREGSTPRDLDNIWTQVLDHLYVVLTLARIE